MAAQLFDLIFTHQACAPEKEEICRTNDLPANFTLLNWIEVRTSDPFCRDLTFSFDIIAANLMFKS
ncbi:hypothetical cytosolic protein [Syntrophus aciditrophicus SB]|uniref:Hypothetical cytosolic protein n=1 Tax=Syntrophus aciditrophicus (strain SB) TaxID=56780 RepID=Q2LWB4_SYNAS|nr:hypothetical cytosolic protein [Syntrophus aciditrophicus SB]